MFQQNSDKMLIIDMNLAIMKEYLKKTDSFFTSIQDKAWNDYKNERYPNSIEEMNERSLDTLGVINIEIKHQRIMHRDLERIPQLHYSSFVITWLAFVENELYELCLFHWENYCKNQKKPTLNHYNSIKKYMNEKMNIVIDGKNRTEQKDKKIEIDKEKCCELESIKKLRNQIAHKGPVFDRKYAEYQKQEYLSDMVEHIQKHNLLTNNGKYTYIKISFDYCMYLIKFTEEFFEEIYDNYNKLDLRGTKRK